MTKVILVLFCLGTCLGLYMMFVSQSWPLLHDGQMLPDPSLSGLAVFSNIEWVHFSHRWIAALTLIMIFAFAWRVKSPWLGLFVIIQFGLGIWTVLSGVSMHVAATHQAGAFILTFLLLRELYKIKYTVQS